MYEAIADEVARFEREEIKGLSTAQSNNYLIARDYEDEFTGQEIEFMQVMVEEAIKDYLHTNEIESFKVYSDWCVHVIDNDLHDELVNGVEPTTDRVDRIEFTDEQIQGFEEADKEDKEFVHDVYVDIENSHLEEVGDDLSHALEVGDILFEVPEDESTIRLLLNLVKEKQQRNAQEVNENNCQEGIYQINEDGNTSLVGTIKKV